ncbi:hypothetical protein WN55_09816 [Dufourea novaeangliae]|uniref:DUF4817 domain-containing protein n=1 Tax=Dufourea novaeangliae TaxID=178035 RepID=A0A154P9D9_DUFNO|nr:hypothetical protein WN55_09816 [Dufourea novaeangliae]
MRYSIAEKVDMVFVYGECRQIVRDAVRLYAERFPEPSRSAFTYVIKSFQETGRVDNKIRRRSKAVTDVRNTVNILAAVTQNPHASTRQLVRESGISQRSVLQILHLNKFHAFHVSLHQELHGNDFQNRANFCPWSVNVWCGLLNGKIIGPYFIDGTLNTSTHFNGNLPHLLENIPLHIRQTMWFQQDGCPAHAARIITQFLNVTFRDSWIGRAGNHK